MHPLGGFYSALDADSESEEGKFYVWDFERSKNGWLMPKSSASFYDITENGNWEGKNILRVKSPLEDFARVKNISVDE